MEPTNAAADEVALCRYEVMAPPLALEGRRGELRAAIRRLASRPARGWVPQRPLRVSWAL